jgi:hypothetical protein
MGKQTIGGAKVELSASLDVPAAKWQCDLGSGEWDHDWQYVCDWYGDPEVINGIADCSFLRCRVCGKEDHEADLSSWRDDDDDYL